MALPNGNMEIVFSFDTTGSMSSCLDEVRGRVSDMVQRLQADIPGIKMAIFAHGDYCDTDKYVTKHVDLTDDVTALVDFAKNAEETYGGDADECYELVLHEVRTLLSWTPGTQRALVMIGDCNPHKPSYPMNKLNLDWKKEADELADIGVRIYSVQCDSDASADFFYKDIARRTGGHHLQLSDFKNIFDFLMAVCYREKGDELFQIYEDEVRTRDGTINKDLDALFVEFRKTPKGGSTPAKSTTSASTSSRKPKAKTSEIVKLSKTPFAKKKTIKGALKAEAATNTSPRKTSKVTTSAAVNKKLAEIEKELPQLNREDVADNDSLLCELKWSSWQQVMSSRMNTRLGITHARRGTGHTSFRAATIFGGKTKVPALYEVAVQTTPRGRKFVLYSKVCKRGIPITKYWESRILGRYDIRAQINKVLAKNCTIFMRRVVLKGTKVMKQATQAQQRYDYAWSAIKYAHQEGHRTVFRNDIEISNSMNYSV